MTRLLLSLILLVPPAALAQNASLLGKFGGWEMFSYSEKGGKVCYLASQPSRSLGAAKQRGKAFLTVTHRQSDKSTGVVSVNQGFAYKKDSPLILDIDGQRFDLYAAGDTAWSRNDKAVVAALQKSKTAVMHGTPAKGDAVADSYVLDGFAKAYATISQACGLH